MNFLVENKIVCNLTLFSLRTYWVSSPLLYLLCWELVSISTQTYGRTTKQYGMVIGQTGGYGPSYTTLTGNFTES